MKKEKLKLDFKVSSTDGDPELRVIPRDPRAELVEVLRETKKKFLKCDEPSTHKKQGVAFDISIAGSSSDDEYDDDLESEAYISYDYNNDDDNYDDGWILVTPEQFLAYEKEWDILFVDICGQEEDDWLRIEIIRINRGDIYIVKSLFVSLETWDSLITLLRKCHLLSIDEAKELHF